MPFLSQSQEHFQKGRNYHGEWSMKEVFKALPEKENKKELYGNHVTIANPMFSSESSQLGLAWTLFHWKKLSSLSSTIATSIALSPFLLTIREKLFNPFKDFIQAIFGCQQIIFSCVDYEFIQRSLMLYLRKVKKCFKKKLYSHVWINVENTIIDKGK